MKKKILILILMICGLCFTTNVFAEETESALCSLEKKNDLRVAASNVTINYQPVEIEDGVGIDDGGNASADHHACPRS